MDMNRPLIPRPIRQKKMAGLSIDENARRDGSRRRNPARYANQYTKNHNAQYPNNPGRQMLEFEDKDNDRALNERAYRIVDTTLRRMLQGMDVYKKKTYHQATNMMWEKMDQVVQELGKNSALAVFAQGEDDWLIKLLLELKMETASREHRKALAAENRRLGTGIPALTEGEAINNGDMVVADQSSAGPVHEENGNVGRVMERRRELIEHPAVNVVPDMDPVHRNGPGYRPETSARRNNPTLGIENETERTPWDSAMAGQGRLPVDSEDEIQTNVEVRLARTRQVRFEDEGTDQPYRNRNTEFSSRTILREDEPVSASGNGTESRMGRIAALQAELDNLRASDIENGHVDTGAYWQGPSGRGDGRSGNLRRAQSLSNAVTNVPATRTGMSMATNPQGKIVSTTPVRAGRSGRPTRTRKAPPKSGLSKRVRRE